MASILLAYCTGLQARCCCCRTVAGRRAGSSASHTRGQSQGLRAWGAAAAIRAAGGVGVNLTGAAGTPHPSPIPPGKDGTVGGSAVERESAEHGLAGRMDLCATKDGGGNLGFCVDAL